VVSERSDIRTDDLAAAERWVLALIAVTLLVRVVLAATVGLGIDESYTVATARSFALSTYDHPPLAWWLAGGAAWLFGTEGPLAGTRALSSCCCAHHLARYSCWFGFYSVTVPDSMRSLTLNLAPVLGWTTGTFVFHRTVAASGSPGFAYYWRGCCSFRTRRPCGGWLRAPAAAWRACPSCTGSSCSPARGSSS
jgi:hypothetical protein